ncbi:MAG TPA: response regulator transcription factor [Bryobacteraceae bacterium]|nr:response regulator transcription factor [Bryobacteraceae bacterium]
MLNSEVVQARRSAGGTEPRLRRWRLILADDHKILLEGLRTILDNSEFEVVATVGDGRSLVTAAAALRPDLIVTDLSMPLLNGLDASRQILRHDPRIKILMLSMHQNSSYAIDAWHAGVRGYILKTAESSELIAAIRRVLDGQLCFEPEMTQAALNSARPRENEAHDSRGSLTQRQREVLQMLAEGKAPKEIAGILGISARTVEFHKYRIMDSLGLHSVPELAVYATKKGIVG